MELRSPTVLIENRIDLTCQTGLAVRKSDPVIALEEQEGYDFDSDESDESDESDGSD